jgi:hypothetical protein
VLCTKQEVPMQNKKTQLKTELKQYRMEYKDVLAALESPYLSVREIEHLDSAADRIGENIDMLEALVKG